MSPKIALNLGALRRVYRAREARPSEVVAEAYRRIAASKLERVWISLVPREAAIARARKLESDPLSAAKPLFGVPFAVNDNLDVAGLATTAGCPDYAYSPTGHSSVVQALIDAGAIPVGKTNLDAFASGLAGTASSYGPCSNALDAAYIAGGPSSGAALAVAGGMVSFALGSETGASACVPAALNGLVGLKPTRGLLSAVGLVPACRTLDTVSIFARTAQDVHTVFQAARGFDPLDAFSRAPTPGQDAAPWVGRAFRFGVPPERQLEFFGDAESPALYRALLDAVAATGGEAVEIDFSPFLAAAELFVNGPWSDERLAELGEFSGRAASAYTAVDTFRALYRLAELRRATETEWSRMDVLVVPTVAAAYTLRQASSDAARTERELGHYTAFVNLLDLAAVSVPAGVRANGTPFGVSFIGPAFRDEALLAVADAAHREVAIVPGPPVELERCPPGCVSLGVVGAYLSGEQLNWQLTERGARRIKACRTAPHYRLYALDRSIAPRPALVRDESFAGPGVELEVWAVPEDRLGGFIDDIAAPLVIGPVTLDDGQSVKGLVCEPSALGKATEITRPGWRNYLAHASPLR